MRSRPLADILNAGISNSYLHTLVSLQDLAEDDNCTICKVNWLHPTEDDGMPCLPIKLPCGHLIGKTCFNEWRLRSGTIGCLSCLQTPASSLRPTTYLKALRWICNTTWFRMHDQRLVDRALSAGEVKLFSGTKMRAHEMAGVVLIQLINLMNFGPAVGAYIMLDFILAVGKAMPSTKEDLHGCIVLKLLMFLLILPASLLVVVTIAGVTFRRDIVGYVVMVVVGCMYDATTWSLVHVIRFLVADLMGFLSVSGLIVVYANSLADA